MYNAYITKITNVRKHTNADRLQCGECFGNTVVVDMSIQDNQVGLYFPVDGQLSEEFALANDLVRRKDENGNYVGGYLDPVKRNIKAIRLRGEKSDGLFLPLQTLAPFVDITTLQVGDVINTVNGHHICQKYIPRTSSPKERSTTKKGSRKPKEYYPWFAEHADTAQLAYNLGAFTPGDICYITLKMHGTSQRTAYTVKTSHKSNWVRRFLRLPAKVNSTWEYITGTRRVVLTDFDKETGFYGSDAFRKPYHDYFKGKLQKGEEVFYEVLGYVNESTLIMPAADNKKTNDKAFIRQYGPTTEFTYGCKPGESIIRVYRMTLTNEDGYTVEYPTELVKQRCAEMGVNFVPIFDKFIYTTEEDLLTRVDAFVDGVDPVGLTHVREGVVVRIDNKPTFKAYKAKNFSFKVLEGICKAEATEADIEEAQELTEE